jgi:hypothetical protein
MIRNLWEFWLTLVDSALTWAAKPLDDIDWSWTEDEIEAQKVEMQTW